MFQRGCKGQLYEDLRNLDSTYDMYIFHFGWRGHLFTLFLVPCILTCVCTCKWVSEKNIARIVDDTFLGHFTSYCPPHFCRFYDVILWYPQVNCQMSERSTFSQKSNISFISLWGCHLNLNKYPQIRKTSRKTDRVLCNNTSV